MTSPGAWGVENKRRTAIRHYIRKEESYIYKAFSALPLLISADTGSGASTAPAACGDGCLIYSFILLSLSAALLLVGALIIIFAFRKEDRAKEMISLLRQAPDSIDILKKTYTPGTRIRLDLMGDDPDPIKSGETGTVVLVDDIGTIHVDWDCGRRLGLVPGIDSFHSLDEPVRDAGKEL